MENEIKLDGRVSPECLYEKRKQVVALHRKGMRLNAICETVGLCWKAVRKAIDLYESGGVRALRPKKWGRPAGTSRTLAAEQEKQVQKDICDKRPEQMKMDFALWTRCHLGTDPSCHLPWRGPPAVRRVEACVAEPADLAKHRRAAELRAQPPCHFAHEPDSAYDKSVNEARVPAKEAIAPAVPTAMPMTDSPRIARLSPLAAAPSPLQR